MLVGVRDSVAQLKKQGRTLAETVVGLDGQDVTAAGGVLSTICLTPARVFFSMGTGVHVNGGVAPAAADQPVIDRDREGARDEEGGGKAAPDDGKVKGAGIGGHPLTFQNHQTPLLCRHVRQGGS